MQRSSGAHAGGREVRPHLERPARSTPSTTTTEGWRGTPRASPAQESHAVAASRGRVQLHGGRAPSVDRGEPPGPARDHARAPERDERAHEVVSPEEPTTTATSSRPLPATVRRGPARTRPSGSPGRRRVRSQPSPVRTARRRVPQRVGEREHALRFHRDVERRRGPDPRPIAARAPPDRGEETGRDHRGPARKRSRSPRSRASSGSPRTMRPRRRPRARRRSGREEALARRSPAARPSSDRPSPGPPSPARLCALMNTVFPDDERHDEDGEVPRIRAKVTTRPPRHGPLDERLHRARVVVAVVAREQRVDLAATPPRRLRPA